jgi:hypothetical protein
MTRSRRADAYLDEKALGPQLNWGGQSPSTSPHKPGQESRLPALGADQPFRLPQGSAITTSTEEDWISPFTLPPVPSIKPLRRNSNPFSSPPQHRKSSSGAYYAAAWGSPITPETRRSIAPLGSPDGREAYSHLVGSRRSERGNWLSDSEGSVRGSPRPAQAADSVEDWLGLEEDDQSDTAARTPTLGSFIESRNKITGTARSGESGAGHRIQDSTATIKQADYWEHSAVRTLPEDNRAAGMASPQSVGNKTEHTTMANPTPGTEKPLPVPPGHLDDAPEMSLSSARPPVRTSSLQSYQRSKTRVVWKGKSCIIAMPVNDGRGSNGAKLFTSADVQARLRRWEEEGYNTAGFVLGDILEGNASGPAGGQSRKIHPDPTDMLVERRSHGYKVSIPDRAQWDAWMEFIKEEKLRALGVTTSNSEPPTSTQSPFSATMSRASSQYPSMPFSPPQPPSSVGSNQLLQNGHVFPPHFSQSRASSQAPSMASPQPQFVGLPGPAHRYKPSVAYPPMDARMTTSPNYPPTQPTPPGPRLQPSPHYFSQRQSSVSPAAVGMQSLGEVLSPVSPFAVESFGGPSQPNVMLDRMRRQQQDLQAQMLRQQQQQIMFNQSRAVNGPHEASDTEKQFLARVEIAHPTPRPHQRNHSEALQREIDEAETLLEREAQGINHLDEPNGKSPQTSLSLRDTPPEQKKVSPTWDLDAVAAAQIAEAAEQSEIETNPSLRTSPMPTDRIQPPLQQPEPFEPEVHLTKDVSTTHKIKPSVSKLNVEAKEFKFDPKAAFLSTNFQFNSTAFQPAATPAQLNAAAPEFQPSTTTITRPSANKFNFSSPTFNVDAPEFNPSGSVASYFSSSIASGSDDPGSATSKIFGEINIDPSSKATRRSNKALPITKPTTDKSDLEERNKLEDDDSGRLAPSMARSKRLRRRGSDGDQEAVYAPHTDQILMSQNVTDNEQNTESDSHKATPGSADTNEQSSPDKWEPFNFQDEVDISMFNSARPPHSVHPLPTTPSSVEMNNPIVPAPTIDHHLKPSLSATAPPFIPVSSRLDFPVAVPTHEPIKPRKSSGLMASRFAATPSPPASPPPLPTSLADVDELYKGSNVAPATKNVLEPSQELVNSRILEKIVSEGHRSDTTADDVPEPQQEFHNGRILEEVASEGHNSDTVNDVPELQRQLPDGRILREIVSDAHVSDDTTDDMLRLKQERPHSRILREIVSEAHLSDAENSAPVFHIDEGSVRSISNLSSASDISDHGREPGPSYEEIDEVMKQLENDPELGVERLETPPAHSSPAPTPQLPPFPNIRSDAPSPSPRRVQNQYVLLERAPRNLQMPFEDVGPGLESQVRKLLGNKDGDISDWNDEVSSPDAQKIQTRAQFFDAHVVDLVGGILDNRVGPMERTLKAIQHSLAVMATRPTSSRHERRSLSTDNRESDADDEDDEDGYEGRDTIMRYQTRSPTGRKDQRSDRLKAIVQDALAAYKAEILEAQGSDLSALPEMLAEMRHLAQHVASESRQTELKAIVEDVIATHPRLRGQRVQQNHDFGANEEKSKLQISGLETMLKMATERADHEAKSRRNVEDELAEALRQLRYAEEEAAHHRESSEEAERTLLAYHKEKESLANLEQTVSELSLKNAALETTLEEYRLSSDQWRDDIQEERIKNKELRHTIHNLKRHVEESTESKQALRSKVDRLQESLAATIRDIASDQAVSRKRELELVTKNEHLQNTLDHEARRREKCELELDQLDKEHKQNVQFRDRCDHLRQENARLEQAMAALRQECKEAQDVAFQSQRELQHARESTERQVQQGTSALEADLRLATSQASIVRADLEAQIARLQDSLKHAELNAANAKEKHDALFDETLESHSRALQQATEEKEAALQNQQTTHEKKLDDLRERHTRALHNSSDDRHRLEHHLNEKLALSDEKVQHLESKVVDLQERLEITKSAARAAVEAATSKGMNLPTPAPSVVASPPHSTLASMPLAKGSDIPEKISPQALRESIMVLQDQLQNREQRIEQLEAELAQVDKEAPTKIKDRDTEITWLRELLGVRIDDLEDIIKSLSQQDYDREAVRDAAIRLRANLQMEQQEKERAASGVSNSFPSIASLSNLTQSPRALPMAAAAAWGNWRKARDSSLGALTDLTNLGNQTPSRSTFGGSPQSFLAGLMTPPSTNQRQATPSAGSAPVPPTMPSLGASDRKASGEARPLRANNAQARSLSARQLEKQPSSSARTSSQQRQPHPEPPSTPPLMRRGSYDGDADVRSLNGDLDADASPIGGKENGALGDTVVGEGELLL